MGTYQGHEKYKESGVEWLGEIPDHWEFRRIKFLCKNIVSGPFGSSLTKDIYTQSGYKIYGQEQVIADNFCIGEYYISEEKYKEMIRYSVEPGDVLVSCVGTFGKIAVVPKNVERGIINPRLIKLNLDKQRIAPKYFGLLLSSEVSFFQFEMLSRGGTMGVVNIGTLCAIELPIPPLDEQESIACFLDRKTTQYRCSHRQKIRPPRKARRKTHRPHQPRRHQRTRFECADERFWGGVVGRYSRTLETWC
jgi:type I restriction enzyme, S subunit